MRMRKLSKEGKGGTPDQAAEGISEGDVERLYMKLPEPRLGRPAVHDLLGSLCEQHAAEASITVIAAGMDLLHCTPACAGILCELLLMALLLLL